MSKLFSKLWKKRKSKKTFRPLKDVLEHRRTKFPCIIQLELNGSNQFGNRTRDRDGTLRNELLEMFIEKKVRMKFVKIEVIELPLNLAEGSTGMPLSSSEVGIGMFK